MKVSREEKKAEAISRMKAMGIYAETIKQFENEDLVSKSEPPFGAFYWVEDEELEEMHEWEKEHNALVYLVIRSYTSVGIMDAYLYVSDHKSEWKIDREYLRENMQIAYVINRDAPECSEFGSIGFERTMAAGLKRIY